MHFINWDPLARAALFSGVFLLPLLVVLWLWYDTSGRDDTGRWYWRIILSATVLLAVPALILGAANVDASQADLLDVLGWLALGAGATTLVGVIAYTFWGRRFTVDQSRTADFFYRVDGEAEETRLMAPPDTAATAAEAARPTIDAEAQTAILLAKAGPERGHQFPIGEIATIGRDVTCSVCLADPRVSSQHAQIKRVDGQYTFLDLRSTNGSHLLVEGREERIRTPQLLLDGDEIRVGRTVLQFIQLPGRGQP